MEKKNPEAIPPRYLCCAEVKLQIPRLRSPGFPVELVGVGESHAAFLTESRTRSGRWSRVQEIRVGMTKLGFVLSFTVVIWMD